jgi:hypothetical protein
MTNTFSTKIAAAARRAGLAALLGASATATVIGFAGAAHAAPGTPVPNANPVVGMYGNPAAAAPYWNLQHYGDCGLMATADVVGQITHHEPTEQQIIALAENTPSKVHAGPIATPTHLNANIGDFPVLLAHYGIHATTSHSNLQSLERALGGGQKVEVTVNSETLTNRGHKSSSPDHEVVVIGVDTQHGVVHINNSWPGGRDYKVSIATFEAAWLPGGAWATITA